ncbi:unnamed protein product [Paramecium octaurelia]|uniref:Uncharacterized protein n=1 Tax=Paramecium octaurelia TaxID=43137 RepID=A0A8S1X9J7_PAROT|nr:unnamed protein product [Paramecium octaurelia]
MHFWFKKKKKRKSTSSLEKHRPYSEIMIMRTRIIPIDQNYEEHLLIMLKKFLEIFQNQRNF